MKKIVLLMLVFALLLSTVACFDAPDPSGTSESTTNKNTASSTTTVSTEEEDNNNPPSDDVMSGVEVYGLSEQIRVSFITNDDYTYAVFYKLKDADDFDYVKLEDELMIADGDTLNCYILGITEGTYKVRIEAYGKNDGVIFGITLTNIEVSAQDRSGYAHFNAVDGVGAYIM